MQYIESIKLVYIHIPKTGGSFIEKNLSLLNKNFFNDNTHFGGHHTIETLKKRINFDISYKYFTIVRNPYYRMISIYNYLKKTEKRNNGDRNEWKYLGEPNNFSEFVYSIYDKYKNNKMTDINNLNMHYVQQFRYTIQKKDEGEVQCQILKYENLDVDFKKLIESYKKNKEIYNFLYKNIYEKINIKDNYNLDDLCINDINMINEIYEKDFLIFGYDKY